MVTLQNWGKLIFKLIIKADNLVSIALFILLLGFFEQKFEK